MHKVKLTLKNCIHLRFVEALLLFDSGRDGVIIGLDDGVSGYPR